MGFAPLYPSYKNTNSMRQCVGWVERSETHDNALPLTKSANPIGDATAPVD